jgi:hypothetical protein
MLSGLFGGMDGGEDGGEEAPFASLYGYQTSSLGGTNHAHRSDCGYAGLLNQGATCYLNSLVQTLFMTPDLRYGLFQLTQEEAEFHLTEYETTTYTENTAEAGGDVSQFDGDSETKSTGEHYQGDFIDSWVNQQSGFTSEFTAGEGGGKEEGSSSTVHENHVGVLPIDEESLLAMGFSHELVEQARGRKFDSADDLIIALFGMLEQSEKAAKKSEQSTPQGVKDGDSLDIDPFEEQKQASIEEEEEEEGSVIGELVKLFFKLQSADRNALSTTALTDAFGWKSVDVHVQHDVQELNRVLLDVVEGKLAQTSQRDLISRLFRGCQCRKIQCRECHTISSGIDVFFDLSLTLKDTLQSSLIEHITPDLLAGDNQYHCSKCEKNVDADVVKCFTELPPMLFLSLNRFQYDVKTSERKKISRDVQYPLKFSLPLSNLDGDTLPDVEYELYSVILHAGSAYGGHYNAYVRDLWKRKWLFFNDSFVEEVAEEKALSAHSGVYMLAYRRCDVDVPEVRELPVHGKEEVERYNVHLDKEREEYITKINTVNFHFVFSAALGNPDGWTKETVMSHRQPMKFDKRQSLDELFQSFGLEYDGVPMFEVGIPYKADAAIYFRRMIHAPCDIVSGSLILICDWRFVEMVLELPLHLTVFVFEGVESISSPIQIDMKVTQGTTLGDISASIDPSTSIPDESRIWHVLGQQSTRSVTLQKDDPILCCGMSPKEISLALGVCQSGKPYVMDYADFMMSTMSICVVIDGTDIEHTISTSIRTTLIDLKEEILKIQSDLISTEMFYLSRMDTLSLPTHMLADETESLLDCGLEDGTKILAIKGAAPKPGSMTLSFKIFEKQRSIDVAFSLVAQRGWTISELKQEIVKSQEGAIVEPFRLRLSDLWGSAGDIVFQEDEQIISKLNLFDDSVLFIEEGRKAISGLLTVDIFKLGEIKVYEESTEMCPSEPVATTHLGEIEIFNSKTFLDLKNAILEKFPTCFEEGTGVEYLRLRGMSPGARFPGTWYSSDTRSLKKFNVFDGSVLYVEELDEPQDMKKMWSKRSILMNVRKRNPSKGTFEPSNLMLFDPIVHGKTFPSNFRSMLSSVYGFPGERMFAAVFSPSNGRWRILARPIKPAEDASKRTEVPHLPIANGSFVAIMDSLDDPEGDDLFFENSEDPYRDDPLLLGPTPSEETLIAVRPKEIALRIRR